MESFQHLRNASSPPGHATVDGKVEGVGEADEHVDEENDLANHLVVEELHHAKTCLFCFLYAIVIYLNKILKPCMFVLFEKSSQEKPTGSSLYLEETMWRRPRTD